MTDLPLIPLPPSSPPDSGFVVLGRFQPFHRGHALMLREAEKCRKVNYPNLKLIIAVGSSNRPETLKNPLPRARQRPGGAAGGGARVYF